MSISIAMKVQIKKYHTAINIAITWSFSFSFSIYYYYKNAFTLTAN